MRRRLACKYCVPLPCKTYDPPVVSTRESLLCNSPVFLPFACGCVSSSSSLDWSYRSLANKTHIALSQILSGKIDEIHVYCFVLEAHKTKPTLTIDVLLAIPLMMSP